MINSSIRGTASAVFFAAAFAAFAGPFVASSDASITVMLSGYAAGGYVNAGFNDQFAWDSNASLQQYSIRAFQHQLTATNGSQSLSWCAEVYQGLDVGNSYTFDVVAAENVPGGAVAPGPMGQLKATIVRDLFSRWIDASTGLVSGAAADRDAKSMAFQVAVWEATHENLSASSAQAALSQMSLTSGAFRATLSASASAWYSTIMQSLGVGGFQEVALEGLSSPTAQDQLRMGVVPAPAAIGVIGVAGLLGARRRR
jgi:hypothetical protein